jgi:predicted Zn-dependent protease
MKRFSSLIIVLAGFLLSSCTATELQNLTEAGMLIAGEDEQKAKEMGQAVGQAAGALGEMPFETERAIGGGIAVKSFADQGPLYPDKDLQRYVNMVGRAVVEVTPRKDYPFSFAVIDRPDVNAWAAPGGYIFITSGAIAEMDSEAQLAGVLAHEVAHVNVGHMVKMLKRQQFFSGVISATEVALEKDMEKYSMAVDAGNDVLFEKGFDRSMEYVADAEGAEYLALTGYDPNGLLHYLEGLENQGGDRGGGWLVSTHPPLNERITRLRQKSIMDFSDIEGAKVADRFLKETAMLRESEVK